MPYRTSVRHKNTTDVRVCQEKNRTFFLIFDIWTKTGRESGENTPELPLTQGERYSRMSAKPNRKQYPRGGVQREGGRCKPFKAVRRRHPVCCGQEMARRTPPLREMKCPSTGWEFRWNRGYVFIRPEPKFAALGAFLCPSQVEREFQHEKQRKDHGKNCRPV